AYSFEAGNGRHEHEWSVWRDTKLPDDKLILPGVVSHATNVVEHPELVAERIGRFVQQVGRERVIASTDCGLGGRVHRDIAWAKLETLAQGAPIASKQGWWGQSRAKNSLLPCAPTTWHNAPDFLESRGPNPHIALGRQCPTGWLRT